MLRGVARRLFLNLPSAKLLCCTQDVENMRIKDVRCFLGLTTRGTPTTLFAVAKVASPSPLLYCGAVESIAV